MRLWENQRTLEFGVGVGVFAKNNASIRAATAAHRRCRAETRCGAPRRVDAPRRHRVCVEPRRCISSYSQPEIRFWKIRAAVTTATGSTRRVDGACASGSGAFYKVKLCFRLRSRCGASFQVDHSTCILSGKKLPPIYNIHTTNPSSLQYRFP